ncbi:MAG: nuclear transport factor 2 family protein [Acidobacteria bacterium]|nr:nuclear transport factor 2 family protein [Acidobacteriota bacterium]
MIAGAATLLLVAAASQQAAPTDDVRELTRLEAVWNDAHERAEAEALERLWSDDLEVAVPKMALMNKSDALRFFRVGRMKFQRYQTSDVRVRLYGDAAVVTGRLRRQRVVNGRQLDDDWRFTKTYVRRSGHWQVVAYHASESAP